jgi:hypothetical protein
LLTGRKVTSVNCNRFHSAEAKTAKAGIYFRSRFVQKLYFTIMSVKAVLQLTKHLPQATCNKRFVQLPENLPAATKRRIYAQAVTSPPDYRHHLAATPGNKCHELLSTFIAVDVQPGMAARKCSF